MAPARQLRDGDNCLEAVSNNPTDRRAGETSKQPVRDARSIRSGDVLRLVVNLQRDLPQLVSMLLAVVRAEEQLEAASHDDAYIRLGAATVAAIGSVEGGALDDWSAHSWPRFRDREDLVCSESAIRGSDTGAYDYSTSMLASIVPLHRLQPMSVV